MGGFAGGEVVELIGESVLDMLDPAGRATCQHGQYRTAPGESVFQPVEELGAFLQYGEVGGEIGVEDVIEPDGVQGSGNLTGAAGACGQAEFLAQSGAHGGCHLNHRNLFRVVQSVPDGVDGIGFHEGAGGADDGALAAHGAICGVKGKPHRGADDRFEAPVLAFDGAYLLYLTAYGNTATAKNTLGSVPGDRRRDVHPGD
ncbi:hypothetical protein SDC9_88089 [bioreactor metagenome]|uniref:Uncharacterized protein n=1 Tax=bioreactor metagenome TaxID=1076179 RepID=A0A644ZV19_9ZZZZ